VSHFGEPAHPRDVTAPRPRLLRAVPREETPAPTPEERAREDAELVVRARAGDAAAEEALYRRHVHGVTRLATRVLGKSDAEDVVQDAFVAALSRLADLREAAAFGGWLRRIALNLVRARLRKRALFAWRRAEDADAQDGMLALASPALGPAELSELAHLDRALAKLDAEPRLAWVLRHVEGWSLDEVAEGLGVSLATAKRRLAVADDAVARHTGEER
jgi:RNA polymerase sigma-70 factor (ECF subfamily)